MSYKKSAGQPKKGAGGKLIRCEIVQTRMTPRLRFYGELVARHQRRSLSSVIEGLIEKMALEYLIPVLLSEEKSTHGHGLSTRHYQEISIKNAAVWLWSPEEADRFAAIALYTPDLLTIEEERVWFVIREKSYFWEYPNTENNNKDDCSAGENCMSSVSFKGLIRDRLREAWPLLSDILHGRKSLDEFKQLKFTDRIE